MGIKPGVSIVYLHEMNDKVYKLVPQHLFSVKVGDEEADAVSLDRFPSHDAELLGTLHEESREFVAKNAVALVVLSDLNAHSNRIN